MNPFSKIQLSHLSVGEHLHDIADLIIVQMKCFGFFFKYYLHFALPPVQTFLFFFYFCH